jgi:hypothetical protein
MADDFRQSGRRIGMDIASTHSHRKGNATAEVQVTGHFSGFACQMRVNQFHLALFHEQKRFSNQPVVVRMPEIKLQDWNIVKAELC